MSKKSSQWKKDRAKRVQQQKVAAHQAELAKARAKEALPDVLGQLEVLFKHNAARAITMAFKENRSPEEIATALEVPVDQVNYLFDVAANTSEELLRILSRWPSAFENPEVLQVAIEAIKSGSYKGLYKSAGL